MLFLMGVETATLEMLEVGLLASASEELTDALVEGAGLADVVTTFREEERTLGARFFLEADNAGRAAGLGCGLFLRGVLHAVTVSSNGPLGVGTRIEARPGLEVEPAPAVARVEVEANAAA